MVFFYQIWCVFCFHKFDDGLLTVDMWYIHHTSLKYCLCMCLVQYDTNTSSMLHNQHVCIITCFLITYKHKWYCTIYEIIYIIYINYIFIITILCLYTNSLSNVVPCHQATWLRSCWHRFQDLWTSCVWQPQANFKGLIGYYEYANRNWRISESVQI